MKFHKISSFFQAPWNLIALAIIAFSFSPSSGRAATGEEILFLPMKVVQLGTADALTQEADKALLKVLAHRGYTLYSRAKAEELLDYQGSWPPAPSVLAAVEAFTGFKSLAIGSLTVIGDQLSLDLQLIDMLSPETPQYFSGTGSGLNQLETIFADIATEISTFTAKEMIIASIAPEGNRKIDSGAILKNIQTKPGDIYNPVSLREDLKSLYKMGYFDDIQIAVSQGPKGKEIIFKIVEKPVIRSITYSGIDELKEETIKEVVTVSEQSILNPSEVNKASEAIQFLYKSKGYYNTKVTTHVTFPSPEVAEIQFIIDEGKKIYIKQISFEGNTAFEDGDLEDEIETNTKGWFSWITDSGLLDYDKLNQDAGRIMNFYGNHGFLEAKIGDPVVTQDEEWLYISFVIEEGVRFKVGDLDIVGDVGEEREELLNLLAIKNETYISRKILREDILVVNDYYAERGYANANVRPSIDASPEQDVLNISISIDKGELVYINRINIRGNTRTRDNVIRRDLKVDEGGIFNVKAMRESVQKLQFLEYFEEVSITPESSFDKSTMDLNIEVKDKSTGMFTIGAGYSSVDHLILMGEISENNFLGRGDTLALSANIGGESSQYSLTYKNPRLYDSNLSWAMELFDTKRDLDEYDKESIGGSVDFGYPIWEKWRAFWGYSYTDTTLSDVSENASYIIRNSVDINITSAVKVSLLRDSRNRQFGASSGSRNTLSVRYAGGPLSGDSQFTKVEGSTAWYFPLPWNSVFHIKGAAGQVFENETDSLPVYERFYLGGLRSIRGFDYADISPKDTVTGESIGGDKMWFTNIELIFPLLAEQGINAVLFYDMGNVYNDDEDWDFKDYRNAVGGGIRWYSPIGPLRLEWGYNLDPQGDEDDTVWDFSIGGIF